MIIDCTFIEGQAAAVLNRCHHLGDRVIPKGFRWNGSSIPLFLVSLLLLNPFHRHLLVPSLGHDFDYQTGRPRAESDWDYLQKYLSYAAGNPWYKKLCHHLQGYAMWTILRLFGWRAYNKCTKQREATNGK